MSCTFKLACKINKINKNLFIKQKIVQFCFICDKRDVCLHCYGTNTCYRLRNETHGNCGHRPVANHCELADDRQELRFNHVFERLFCKGTS